MSSNAYVRGWLHPEPDSSCPPQPMHSIKPCQPLASSTPCCPNQPKQPSSHMQPKPSRQSQHTQPHPLTNSMTTIITPSRPTPSPTNSPMHPIKPYTANYSIVSFATACRQSTSSQPSKTDIRITPMVAQAQPHREPNQDHSNKPPTHPA